jgi:hypothetical protein
MMWSRTRTYTYRGFRPAAVRRQHRRRYAAGLSALALAGASPVFLDQLTNSHHTAAGPQVLDAAAVEVTHFGPRVVVYSLPSRRGHAGNDGDDSGSSGGSSSVAGSGSESSSPIQSENNTVDPQIMDGPAGQATVTNSNPQGSMTIINGESNAARSRGSTSAASPGPGGVVTLAAPQLPSVSRAPVWPPLQTENGTSAPSVYGTVVAGPGASAIPDAASPPALVPPSTQGPAAGPGSGSWTFAVAPVQVLMQVQCPTAAPAGAVCFEAISGNGSAAALPATISAVGDLPVSAPGSVCPAAVASAPEAPGIGAAGNGGTSRNGSSDGGDESIGSEKADDNDSTNKKHSTKGHKAKDTAAVVPIGDGAASPTLASCGLLGPTTPSGFTTDVARGLTSGANVDLSALEAKSGEQIELTGYSFQDNQGGNNAKISCPQIHQQAGGTGTYEDPITVASGGKSGSASADGIKCGDRFYLPSVQRYVIVEDTGNTPNKSQPHLDMYVGDDPDKKCMNSISGTVTAIRHPPARLPVLAGPIGDHRSCRLPGGQS